MNFDSGLFGGTQVPYTRTIEPQAIGLYANLEQRDLERLQRYEEHWRFYLGQQWSFTREDGEPLVTINVIRMLIDRGISWLIGNGWTNEIPDKMEDFMRPHLDEVWEANEKDEVTFSLAQMGSVTGDAWILITSEPTEGGGSRIRVRDLGSESVFPIWDPLNTDILLGVRIVTLFVDDSGTAPASGGPPNVRRFIQVITKDSISEQFVGKEQPRIRPNPLGEIPVVHIRNLTVAREFWGLSDMDGGLIDLQRELNEKATDFSDTVNYHAHPITVITGAKVDNLERGTKRVWSGFPMGTTVTNLSMDGDLPALQGYMDRLERYMLSMTDLPGTKIGETTTPSNTSGVALQTQYQGIVERVKRKRPSYEKALSRANYFILRWKVINEGLTLPENFCAHCGGKIVQVVLKDTTGKVRRDRYNRAVTKPKCYHADPWTNDFIEPDQLRIQFFRRFSYGVEVKNIPRWRAVADILNRTASFWDPLASVQDGKVPLTVAEAELEYRKQQEAVLNRDSYVPSQDDEDQDAPPTDDKIEVPEEPEHVDLLVEQLDPLTGKSLVGPDGKPVYISQSLFLVPTGCCRPKVWNPLHIKVKLKDALPRDEHLEAQLCTQMVLAGLWSRRYAMGRMKVEDKDKMFEEIEKEGWQSPNSKEAAPPATAMQGKEEQRQAERGGANFKAPGVPAAPSPGRPQNDPE